MCIRFSPKIYYCGKSFQGKQILALLETLPWLPVHCTQILCTKHIYIYIDINFIDEYIFMDKKDINIYVYVALAIHFCNQKYMINHWK